MATRGICADVLRVVISDHVLVISETVLDELCRVLRDKLGVPDATVEAAEVFFRRQGIVIGQANVLVTGDRDLLEVARGAPVDIVTPRGFWESLRR